MDDFAIAIGTAFHGPEGPSQRQTEDVFYFCGSDCRLKWAEKWGYLQGDGDLEWLFNTRGEVERFVELISTNGYSPDCRVYCTACGDLIHEGSDVYDD